MISPNIRRQNPAEAKQVYISLYLGEGCGVRSGRGTGTRRLAALALNHGGGWKMQQHPETG